MLLIVGGSDICGFDVGGANVRSSDVSGSDVGGSDVGCPDVANVSGSDVGGSDVGGLPDVGPATCDNRDAEVDDNDVSTRVRLRHLLSPAPKYNKRISLGIGQHLLICLFDVTKLLSF